MNRNELQDLAQIRLAEARLLLKAASPDGAYYLAGYSVECGLKACIAKRTRRYDFPDQKVVVASHTHQLRELVKVANLEVARSEQAKRDAVFRDDWDLVQQWSEHSRYRCIELPAATALVTAVGNLRSGILPWIKQLW